MLENLFAFVVEDDAHCLLVMSKTLRELGIQFKRNTNGANVLPQLYTMYPRPNFILLTIDLPDENAYAIARYITSDAALKDIPVIGVGHADSSAIARMQSCGFSGVIGKPIQRSRLGGLLRQVLSGEPLWPATA